jgi:hypothetical protein
MPEELSPEAQDLIARIAANQRPAREDEPGAMAFIAEGDPVVRCDRCGRPWTDASGGQRAGSRSTLIDNAKAAGWQERSRFGAVRDYCPTCARSIQEREEARRRPKRRTR